jgi:phenylacetate-CoA ligase
MSLDLKALAIRRVVYPAWALRNHSARLRYLREMRGSQRWTASTLQQHQLTLLKTVLKHAYDTCPFYRSKFDAARFRPDELRSLSEISRVPTVSKEEIQANRDAMISTAYRRESLIEDMTGGSTGSPMRFFYDSDRKDWREAASLRHDEWSGWRIGASKAILWGASQDMKAPPNLMAHIREQWVERRLILDASALDDAAMWRFAKQLQEQRPFLLLAYANTLLLFSRFVRAQQIQGIQPGAIITSAEVLTPEARIEIEATLNCKIFNRYGCREFAVIASECEAHGAMHVNAENLLVEVLDRGAPVADGVGEIVITDLRNLAMPMIRYVIRDTGKLVSGACTCGRGLPRLEMAGGRATDFLTATSGGKVSGIVIATYVSTNVPGIAQMQIVQHQLGRVTVRLVRGPLWGAAARTKLEAKLREYLGTDMAIDFEFVEAIAHEKSGKFRFSVSHL